MRWGYWILDIATTLSECFALWILAGVICVSPQKGRLRWLPYAVSFFVAYLFTWMIDNAIWKLPILLFLIGIALWIGYGCSLYNAAVCTFLHIALLGAAEDIALLLCLPIYKDIYYVLAGQYFAIVPVYFMTIALRLSSSLLMKRMLRNFQYPFTYKDFCTVLVVFLPSFAIFSFETVNFLNGIWFVGMEILDSALCIALIVLVLYQKNYMFLRNQSEQDRLRLEQLQRQFDYYQDKQRDEERVRRIYHDMKNHLLLLQAQTENGQEVQNSIRTLQEQIQEYENYHHTGNEFLDVIIRDKAKAAQEKQIDFAAAIAFADGAFLEPLDISTIFGNALDNAIEASEKLPADQRLITVKAGRVRDMLVITVENNTLPDQSVPDGTTKPDAFVHGFGLPNIQRTVEKYGGQCSIRTEDEKFTLKILIPIPS